jgi:hypothetical protein
MHAACGTGESDADKESWKDRRQPGVQEAPSEEVSKECSPDEKDFIVQSIEGTDNEWKDIPCDDMKMIGVGTSVATLVVRLNAPRAATAKPATIIPPRSSGWGKSRPSEATKATTPVCQATSSG